MGVIPIRKSKILSILLLYIRFVKVISSLKERLLTIESVSPGDALDKKRIEVRGDNRTTVPATSV